jgi:hypothetical protein
MSRKIADVEKFGIKRLPCTLGEHEQDIDKFAKLKTGSYASWCRPCWTKYTQAMRNMKPKVKRLSDIRNAIYQCQKSISKQKKKLKNLENLLSRELHKQGMGEGVLPATPVSQDRQKNGKAKGIFHQAAGDQQGVFPGEQTICKGPSELCNHLPGLHREDAGSTPYERKGEVPDGPKHLATSLQCL